MLDLKKREWECDADERMRYTLGSVRKGLNVLCVGINPSTAIIEDDHHRLLSHGTPTFDATMDKVIAWVNEAGSGDGNETYVGLMMVNLFPFRTSKIAELESYVAAYSEKGDELDKLLERNREKIREVLRRRDCRFDIWLAWGDCIENLGHGAYKAQAIDLLESIREAAPESRWFHVGRLTAKKHPRHPSRNHDFERHYFDIESYKALLDGRLPEKKETHETGNG